NIQRLIQTSRQKLNQELSEINRKLGEYDRKANKLPEQEKKFLNASRGYAINDELYSHLLSRYSQAELSIASNVSDIGIIDYAKNLGQGPISPNRKANMAIGMFLAILIPTLILLVREILDTKIKGIPDIIKVSHIPFIGAIGSNSDNNPLVVVERPKSGVSEAFRAIRSNLKFLYKSGNSGSNKTILITSSIGGEGKTFISMNLASVLAASNRKTILIGMDLRKPKIFDEFGLKNSAGLS